MDLIVQRQHIVIIKWVGSEDKDSLKGTQRSGCIPDEGG